MGIILLFHNNPKYFFDSYNRILELSSPYDDTGNSIFIHYFYVLYDLYKNKSDKIADNIYEKNFNYFFQNKAKYLSVQDYSLETSLHKLAKFRDKKFFLKICEKLKAINILDEELLLIKDLNEKSCFDYILEEINVNKNKIIANSFEQFQQFFNYFPKLIKSLSLENQKLIMSYSCKITFTEKKLNEINFNETIKSLYDLKEKCDDTINIFQFLYYPNDSGINYLNYLFHICNDIPDYDKLIQLILDLLLIEVNDKYFKKFCLSEHISYVLRNMNSKKHKGEIEINYGIQLINQIIPILIKDESKKNAIKIILLTKKINKVKSIKNNNRGICNSLISNSNLLFEQKYKIFQLLEKILGHYFNDIVNIHFLCIYTFFNDYHNNKINEENINTIIKDNIFVQRIFDDCYFIEEVYKRVFYISKNCKQITINEYISELNEFINNNKLDIFDEYKINYNLPKERIEIIIKFILAYMKQKYSNIIEENVKESRRSFKCDALFKKFMKSKPKFITIFLQTYENEYNKYDFLTTFFSFSYDYEIIFKDEKIINYFKKINFNYFPDKQLFIKKFKQSLKIVKNKFYEFLFYKFVLKHFPLKIIFNTEISEFTILMERFIDKLTYNWEEECNFTEIIKFIDENILIFCFMFFKNNENPEKVKMKIIFFFDEFINILEPNFKNKFILYRELALEYIYYNKHNNNLINLKNNCYLSILLIFVRLKFGKYNPQFLIMFFLYYNNAIYSVFLSFLKSYFATVSKKGIVYHYLFSEDDLNHKDDEKIKVKKINNKIFFSNF